MRIWDIDIEKEWWCTIKEMVVFVLDLLKDIDGLVEEYLKNVRGMSLEKRI